MILLLPLKGVKIYLDKRKNRFNKESKMKKLFLTISVVIFFLSACGGGGYGSSSPPYSPPTSVPQGFQGIVPEQVDPVQTTEN